MLGLRCLFDYTKREKDFCLFRCGFSETRIIGFFSNKWYQRVKFATLVFSCVDQMEESSSSNNTMIKLTATNYSIWKSRMEDLLCCLDYEDTILGDEGKPKEMVDKD